MPFENLLTGCVTLVTVIGALSFFVSLVIQLTKEFIPKVIPTKLYTLVVSIVVTVVSVLCYLSYNSVEIKPYLVIGSFALGFIVSFIAVYGWDEFKELKDRFMKK